METTDHRRLVSQLAEDLSWLEEHCRRSPDLGSQAGQLRLAAGLVRNIIGPFLNGQDPVPLHVAVVGGAGAGKSTIVNFLTGTNLAEANPQAGYTRHPTAYVTAALEAKWPAHAGFLGPLQRLTKPAPSNLDEDVYQVRPLPTVQGKSPIQNCVVWDCPDMTTWAAIGYVSRLMEIASLADVVVYVASDERYNDEVPTQFLQLLVKAGKPVIVCLTKMRESDAATLVSHFQMEVLGKLPLGANGKSTVPVLPIPFLTAEQLREPLQTASAYRIPLLNQIIVLTDPPASARKRTVENALKFMAGSADGLLEVAKTDLAALDDWRALVQTAEVEFDSRYRREFLNAERFRRFDETRQQILDRLELPGAGRFVSGVSWLLRTPYRLLRDFVGKAVVRPETGNIPEHDVLFGALRGWLDQLRAEALRRADSHPLWKHVVHGFTGGLAETSTDRFESDFRRFHLGSADQIEATCKAILEGLDRNPYLLGAMRIAKLVLDAAAVVLGLWAAGWFTLWDFVTVPVFVSVAQQIVEVLVWQYVEGKRSQIRSRKEAMVGQYISAPLAEWLAQWPATGGSTYERMQITLRRVPRLIQELKATAEPLLSTLKCAEPTSASTPPTPGATALPS